MSLRDRIAAAPISWGVCEVPGWGHQLTPDQVLADMAELGIRATEFGPDGFLPTEPAARAALLAAHHLQAIGGFFPVVLHDPGIDPLPAVEAELDAYEAAGAEVLVLAAATGLAGYDTRPELDDAGWDRALSALDRITARAAERGVRATLHPHVGTVVENRSEVLRVLEGSRIPLCLDTGHLLIGGTSPAELLAAWAHRVGHTHLKDVDEALAQRVQRGELTYSAAVREGMYRPLGQGDVDIARVIALLEQAGYPGWYAMEQDTVLTGEADHAGALADVRASIAFLRALDARDA